MSLNKKPDVNDPRVWKSYSPEKCKGCWAGCCTMPVEILSSDVVRLGLADAEELDSDAKYVARRLMKEGLVKSYREKTGLFMLASQSNGDCIYLGKDRLCKVYERRPDVCRKFPAQMGPRIGFCPAGPKTI